MDELDWEGVRGKLDIDLDNLIDLDKIDTKLTLTDDDILDSIQLDDGNQSQQPQQQHQSHHRPTTEPELERLKGKNDEKRTTRLPQPLEGEEYLELAEMIKKLDMRFDSIVRRIQREIDNCQSKLQQR